METILITNDPNIAKDAQEAGVTRIMVDLESAGKKERQATRNTFISKHQKEDIIVVRRVLSKCPLIVRINPWNSDSKPELEYAIENGADIIMLPMIKSVSDVQDFIVSIAGRAKPLPLIETIYSMEHLREIAENPAISELYIGLNDLHLELGMNFLFEPLALGLLDKMTAVIKDAGKSFGFGGIAAIGSGELPAERILAEHARLGSRRIILSSRFCKDVEITEAVGRVSRLKDALGKLDETYNRLRQRSLEQQQEDAKLTAEMISAIANRLAS
jgi:citrate lyase beta subunit